ncbi:MAG: ABC transporter substrate-binding protein [Chloroflexi bacterium]|nr:ABC transporter substrate-binding protein [Chloroflexota bacterium]
MPVLRRVSTLCLLLTLAAGAFSSVLVINPAQAADPAQSGDPVQDSDTIVIGFTALPRSLDPGDAYDFTSWEVLQHLYTGLVRQKPGAFTTSALAEYDPANDDDIIGVYGYELALAEAVDISDDRLTYTFTLREDAAFDDGTPITAQIFADSLVRAQNLGTGAVQAITPYIDNFQANGERELVFRLKQPTPYFLALLALPPYFPVHPNLPNNEARFDPVNSSELIGNGPYQLASFAYGEELVLRANPDYRYGPAARTETIVLRAYPRSQDLRNAIRDREIDIAWRSLYLGHVLELEDANIAGLTISKVPSTRVYYVYMNHSEEVYEDETTSSRPTISTLPRRPFSVPQVREAVTLLVDRPSVTDVYLEGNATPLTSVVPTLFPDAYEDIWPMVPDVDSANEKLIEAGYNNNNDQNRLAFSLFASQSSYGVLYAAAADELASESFTPTDYINRGARNASVSQGSAQDFANELSNGRLQIALFAWTPIVPHPHAYLWPLAHSSQPLPSNGAFSRDEFDSRLEDAALLDDPAAQGQLYREVSRLLYNEYALIPVWQDDIQVLAWDDISGVLVEPNFLLRYDQLYRE